MHKNVLVNLKITNINVIPCKHLSNWKYILIMNDFLSLCSNLLIHIVSDNHIWLFTLFKTPESRKHPLIALGIYPVITVNNLKKLTCSMLKPRINSITMSTILLMYSFNYFWIFLLITLCYLICIILC